MERQQRLYKNIVIVLANICSSNKAKAFIRKNIGVQQHFVSQINNLLFLEKDNKVDLEGQKYASKFAQILADITDKNHTIIKPNTITLDEIERAQFKFIDFIAQETSIKKADLQNTSVKIDFKSLDKNSEFDPDQLDKVFKNNNFQKNTNQAYVQHDESGINKNLNNNNNNNTNNNTNQQNNFNQNVPPNMNMFGGGTPFMGGTPLPGGHFPVHPRFDKRFYPYNKKVKYMEHLKISLAIIVILTCLSIFIMTMIGYITPFSLKGFWVWNTGSKGKFAPWDPNSPGPGSTASKSTVKVSLSPTSSFLIGLCAIIPGIWIGYSMLANPRIPSEKYIMRPFTLVANLILLLITLYALIIFLIPSTLHDSLKSNFAQPTGGESAPKGGEDAALKAMVDQIKSSGIYKTIKFFDIISLVFIGISSFAIGFCLLINPRLNHQKLMRANVEYQKAVQAQFQGRKYEIDPTLYDEELSAKVKEEEKQNNTGDSNSPPPSY